MRVSAGLCVAERSLQEQANNTRTVVVVAAGVHEAAPFSFVSRPLLLPEVCHSPLLQCLLRVVGAPRVVVQRASETFEIFDLLAGCTVQSDEALVPRSFLRPSLICHLGHGHPQLGSSLKLVVVRHTNPRCLIDALVRGGGRGRSALFRYALLWGSLSRCCSWRSDISHNRTCGRRNITSSIREKQYIRGKLMCL